MTSFRKLLGDATLDALYRLHDGYTTDGSTRDKMLAFFGYPHHCLVCKAPLQWTGANLPDDVDPWFCGQHCPICDRGVVKEKVTVDDH